jgi:hypothetical protein
MWALGCIFAELLALQPIFKGEEVKMDNKKTVPFQRGQMQKIIEILGTPTRIPRPPSTANSQATNGQALICTPNTLTSPPSNNTPTIYGNGMATTTENRPQALTSSPNSLSTTQTNGSQPWKLFSTNSFTKNEGGQRMFSRARPSSIPVGRSQNKKGILYGQEVGGLEQRV